MEENPAIELIQMDGEVLVDSRIVAKGIDVQHQTFLETIYTYQSELEEFGLLRFETDAVKTPTSRGAKYSRYVMLNRNQAGVAISFSRNTKQVVRFKVDLFKAINAMEEHIHSLHNHIQETETRLQELVTSLQSQIKAMPKATLMPADRDFAEITTVRLRQFMKDARQFMEDAQKKRKISTADADDLLGMLSGLSEQMNELHGLIREDKELEYSSMRIFIHCQKALDSLPSSQKLLN